MIRRRNLCGSRIALQDAVNRLFLREIERYSFKARGSGKSGLLSVSRPGQEVLERSAVTIDPKDGSLLVRFACGFPANGRTINAGELDRILSDSSYLSADLAMPRRQEIFGCFNRYRGLRI